MLTIEDIEEFVKGNGYDFIEAYRKGLKNGYTTWYIKFFNSRHEVIDVSYAHFKTSIKYGYNFNNYKIINTYKIYGDIVYLTTNNKQGDKFTTIFDVKNLELVKKYKWFVSKDMYVIASVKGKALQLHRLITNCPKDLYVDHINHNTLDNTNKNLSICTRQENQKNRIDNYKKWNIYGIL